MPTTYAQAGVNIDEGERLVREIKGAARSTFRKGVLGDIGAFGAFFEARFKGLRAPVLVSSVDGVGTKLLIAQRMNRHDTVGQDLVNHCVNDILTCGARPLFFLDYFAAGKLRVDVAASVIRGMSKACLENGCSLVGGETAEMPGMYGENEYDLAGTIVGVVEKGKIIEGKKRVRKGDVLIGLPSSGLHTNGYSLARKVLLNNGAPEQFHQELGTTVGETLMAVHRSYLRLVAPLIERFEIHAISHITGGGIEGNTMRVVPPRRRLAVDWNSWVRPPIFGLIQKLGDVPEDDMRRTFNLGVGMILIVPVRLADAVLAALTRRREHALLMGEII